MTTSKILILLVLTICNVCIHWILYTVHEHLKVKVLICLQCGSCGFDAFVELLLYLWSLCYIGDIVYENSCSRWGSCHGELNATNLIVSLIADHSGDKADEYLLMVAFLHYINNIGKQFYWEIHQQTAIVDTRTAFT